MFWLIGGCTGTKPHLTTPATEIIRPVRSSTAGKVAGNHQTAREVDLAGYHVQQHGDASDSTEDGQDDAVTDGQLPAVAAPPAAPEVIATPDSDPPDGPVSVADVIASIHATFPLLEAAYQENVIAAGNQVAAWGAFDTKLKAKSEVGPLGFYETYRNQAELAQPLYGGGEFFGAFRAGRGNFQPWYLERETNAGGEFKAGISVPLLRNREIDARRAELWRATYDRQRAEPAIRTQLIFFVRDGSVAFWSWVAAGRRYKIGQQALQLAQQRNSQLKRRVDEGDLDPPILQDNLRAIAQRQAKLIDLQRKLQQAGIKLSLFYRSDDGVPRLPGESNLGDFPEPLEISPAQLESDLNAALNERPELSVLDAEIRRVNVDLAEARNDLLPTVDAQVVGSQDMGAPTSSLRDKSEFELEAGILFELPVQRRKARGKSQAAQGKLVRLSAERRFAEDKIRTEVQSAYAALMAAFKRLGRARESRRLAEYMAQVERRTLELGGSDLFAVVLREQIAIEAAEAEVDALMEYFFAEADYNAAMARDWPP
ncbi:MAG: TolC family protein [Pirellulales bacterium]|nr:TolC family protein [Pirellulales bacterium]